jgi:hypothetical protein
LPYPLHAPTPRTLQEYEIEAWGARELAAALAALGSLGAPSLALQQQLQQLLVEACAPLLEEAARLGLAAELARALGAFDARLNEEARSQLWAALAAPLLANGEVAGALGPRGYTALLRAGVALGVDMEGLMAQLARALQAGGSSSSGGGAMGEPSGALSSSWFMDGEVEGERDTAAPALGQQGAAFGPEEVLSLLEALREEEVQPPAAVLQAAARALATQAAGPAGAGRARRLLQLADGAGWRLPVAAKLELVKAAGAAKGGFGLQPARG